jgi:hypothetical protein
VGDERRLPSFCDTVAAKRDFGVTTIFVHYREPLAGTSLGARTRKRAQCPALQSSH